MYSYKDGSKHPVPSIRSTDAPQSAHRNSRVQEGYGLIRTYHGKHEALLRTARPLLKDAQAWVTSARHHDTNLPLLSRIDRELAVLGQHFSELEEYNHIIDAMKPPERGIGFLQVAGQRVVLKHYIALDNAIGTQLTLIDGLTRHFSTELQPFVGQIPHEKRNALFDFCDGMRETLQGMSSALITSDRQLAATASGKGR